MHYICKDSDKGNFGKREQILNAGRWLNLGGKNPLTEEKRKTHRLKLNIEAVCQGRDKFFKAYVLDISPGGLKMESQTRLEKGDRLKLTVEWKNPLKLEGTVRWSQKDGLHHIYGVQFTNLNEEQDAGIREITQDIFWKNYGG